MAPIIIAALLLIAMAAVVLVTSRWRWPAPRRLPRNWNRTDLGELFPKVGVGQSKKQVVQLLGKPDQVRKYPAPSGGVWEFWHYQSAKVTIGLSFSGQGQLERVERSERE